MIILVKDYIGGLFTEQKHERQNSNQQQLSYNNFIFVDYAIDPTIFQPTDYNNRRNNGINGEVYTISIDEECNRVYMGGNFLLNGRGLQLHNVGILNTDTNLITYNNEDKLFTAGYSATAYSLSNTDPTGPQIIGFDNIVFCSKLHPRNRYLFLGGTFQNTKNTRGDDVFKASYVCKVQLNTYNLVLKQITDEHSNYFCNRQGNLVSYLNIPDGTKISLLSDIFQYNSPFNGLPNINPQNYVLWQEL